MEALYSTSTAIRGIRWLTEPALYPGSFGDVWACTWADDGHIYAAADDTRGIDNACNSNLAIHCVMGFPPDHHVQTINAMADYGPIGYVDGRDTWKASGLVSVDGVLYLGVSQHSGASDYPDNIQRVYDASIIKSEDHGRTWSAKPDVGRAMFPGPRFGSPYFVQFGQDYDGALDDYVYAVSNGDTWNNGNYMVMGRVRRDLIGRLDPGDWEFLTGTDDRNQASWQQGVLRSHPRPRPAAIFKHRGFTSMTGIQYVPAVDRFVLAQWAYTYLDGSKPWDQTALVLYEAARPWGPWFHFHTEPDWGVSYYNPSLPAKWFEDGGRRMWITMAGNFQQTPGAPFAYGFTVQKLELLC